jgi:hypothetical protein
MTSFDRDLLAPILTPPPPDERSSGRALAARPLGGATIDSTALHVPGRVGAGALLANETLGSGRYRIRCYFATWDGGLRPPFTLVFTREGRGAFRTEAALVAVEAIEHAAVADFELDVAPEHAVLPADLRLQAFAGAGFDLIGAHIDRLARVLTRSVLDLPVDRPLWLYGAGQGGRQAKRKLELLGFRVSGFIDKVKTGDLEGVPILSLDAARETVGPDTTLVIASMFWEEIRADIEAAGLTTTLYSFYPLTGDVVYALN